MSISVAISRRSDPFDESGPAIEKDEWQAIANSSTDFQFSADAIYLWTGNAAAVPIAFEWWDGQVEVKNPDAVTIARMKQLARKMNATVFSETGEVFNEAGHSAGFLPGFP